MLKVVKHTMKFPTVLADLNFVKAAIKKAPNAVIGAIYNLALNCCQNAVHI